MAPPGKPTDRFTAAARMATAVMKSDEGPNVAALEATSWDTHDSARARALDGLIRA